MDQKQNRVAKDRQQVDAMTQQWGQRYGNGSKRAQKEFARSRLALQKEVVRRYEGKPLTEHEKRELRMLKAENRDLAKESRPTLKERAGNGLRGAGRLLLKGTGFVFGVVGMAVLAVAGWMGFKGAARKPAPVVKLANNAQSRVLNNNSAAGKVFNPAKRYYGKDAKQHKRSAPRVSNGLGR